jgi:hypothetical protein
VRPDKVPGQTLHNAREWDKFVVESNKVKEDDDSFISYGCKRCKSIIIDPKRTII